MSKKILIVEGDVALSRSMRAALEAKGFQVEETSDGKGSIELIRRQKPDLTLLAVELPAGQNGYILCGKLKKDDELKTLPIVIIGNPDGFAQHRKLKTRADDYVPKPLDPQQVVQTVGGLIGLPELVQPDLMDESLSLSDLVDDTGMQEGIAEEISVDTQDEATVHGDPELDMLDAAFDGISTPSQAQHADALGDEPLLQTQDEGDEPLALVEEEGSPQASLHEEPDNLTAFDAFGSEVSVSSDDSDSMLEGLGEMDDENERTQMVVVAPPPPPPPQVLPPKPAPVTAKPAPTPALAPVAPTPTDPPPAPVPAPVSPPLAAMPALPLRAAAPSGTSPADAAELRTLRAKVSELQAALDDANNRLIDTDARAQQLEQDLHTREVELETARAAGGKNDKEFFTLRESVNRKDKEILKLKAEINEKDKEIVELRDQHMHLEQQASESSGEIARRDAQIKTLSARADQLTAEKRKADQALMAANQEARAATAKLNAMQGEMDQAHAHLDAANGELEQLRGQYNELQSVAQQAQEQSATFQVELEQMRSSYETVHREAEEIRSQLDQATQEVETQRTLVASSQEESDSLRRQLTEAQEATSQNEDRLTKLYKRMKGEEQHRDKARKALAVALQLLDEQPSAGDQDGADDEPAVA